jgi:hypothetical protein
MLKSLIKLSVLAAGTFAARSAYTALKRRNEEQDSQRQPSPRSGAKAPSVRGAGQPAEAFSKDAIQHDLSVGDAA